MPKYDKPQRALALAWGVVLLGIIYSEIGITSRANPITVLLDAVTEDGPAAAAGFLIGATAMQILASSHSRDELQTRARDFLAATLTALVLGLVLQSIQIAIVPVLLSVGIVGAVSAGFVRFSSLALSLILFASTVLSSFVHPVFVMAPPIGGPYPALAWISYGLAGILVYRFMLVKRKNVYIVFWLGIIIGFVGFLTVLPNYFPETFGISQEMGDYYRKHPQISPALFLSSAAHSGGLLNVLGNIAVGSYVLSAAMVLAGLRILEPLVSAGRMATTIYSVYVVLMAIPLGGYPGFGDEIRAAVSPPETAVESKTLDWPTFKSWVSQSESWADLNGYERAFYGKDTTALIDTSKTDALNASERRDYFPLVALLVLTLPFLWLRFFSAGPIEMFMRPGRTRVADASED